MTEERINRAAALFDLTDEVAIITGGAGLLGYHHGAILAAAERTLYCSILRRPVPTSCFAAHDRVRSRSAGYRLRYYSRIVLWNPRVL